VPAPSGRHANGATGPHFRRGVFVPDNTTGTFESTSDHGGTDDADGRGVPTWSGRGIRTAPTPAGLFSNDVWLRLLAEAGFEPEAVTEQTTEDRTPRELFVGHRRG
jgi:hypothetical protein